MRFRSFRGPILGLAAAVAASVLAGLPATPPAEAQIRCGGFWLVQPHQTARVGRAWANADRTVEYWAYVDGEYRWADASNGPANRWRLDAEFEGSTSFGSFEAFRDATLALPEFDGKVLVFQQHVVTETVVQN
jgi:hypothetical protein